MFLFKLLSGTLLIPLIVLAAMNPSLEDGMTEVTTRIKEEQSTMRAGWNGITRVTGLDWLGKQAGMGSYELCRKNVFIGSLFAVRQGDGNDPEDLLAVGFGVAGRIWGEKLMESGDMSDKVLNGVARPLAGLVHFSECAVFKKSGKLL